jgi:hypothetical protein
MAAMPADAAHVACSGHQQAFSYGREARFSSTQALIQAVTMMHSWGTGMRRRQSLRVLGGAGASSPTVAAAQQPLKIIGFLRAGGGRASLVLRLSQSLSQTLSLGRESTEKHYG